MTKDAKQSLIALTSVLLLIGAFVATAPLMETINMPSWVLPSGLILMTLDFAWRAIKAVRRRNGSKQQDVH